VLELDAAMPAPLRERVAALLIARGSDAMECRSEGSAPSTQELLEAVTSHVKEPHAMRSWPPEYWVHVRACIRAVD
jgi:predicted small metal-binding protein